MWGYLAVLLLGFWLGVAIFLYVSCYWLEEILDLPQQRLGSNHGASGAHAQLKRLVARVVEEAAALPALARYAAEPHTPTESSTYEDLLATAILNKVIERYQTESGSGGRSSGIHSASASPSPSDRSSPRSLHSRTTRDITPPLREEEDDASDWEEGEATDEALEVPRRVPFPEFGGDIVHASDNEYRDFDEVSGSDIQAIDGTWEENWLFQKKKIKNMQSAPVPMLVPNSNTQYRALIGDRDADDTTDLSDNASDNEEELEYKSDIKKVLDSKHVIGGKPKVEEVLDFEPDSLMIIDDTDETIDDNKNENINSTENVIQNNNNENVILNNNDESHDSILVLGVDSGPLPKAEFNLKEEIHRTLLNGNVLNGNVGNDENSIGEDTIDSNTITPYKDSSNTLNRSEREKDYEETEALPVQRYADSLRRKHFEEPKNYFTPNHENEDELIPGSIADRERKKWLNYVDMPNNPYSPEAIKKRLSTKSTSSLFDSILTKNDLEEREEPKLNGHKQDSIEKVDKRQLNQSLSTDESDGRRSVSPSNRVLKHVVSEDIPQYKRYGRDYYVKEARSSSGERKRGTRSLSSNKSTSLESFDRDSPGLLIQQFNTIATNQQYTKFSKDNDNVSITTMPIEYRNEILIEYEDANEQTLFAAKPAYTDEDTDRQFEEILQYAYNSDEINENDESEKETENKSSVFEIPSIEISLSSSSVEDSIKIYNVQTGEIVKCKPEDKIDRYGDRNDNIDIDKSTEASSESSEVRDVLTVDSLEDHRTELDELANLPSVKELARKFVSMEALNEPIKPPQPIIRRQRSKENILGPDNKHKLNYMHSLTARSISREFREELKLSMATPLTVPGGSKEIPEGTEDITRESTSRPGSPVPEPGTIKSKLAFFESLKNKISNK